MTNGTEQNGYQGGLPGLFAVVYDELLTRAHWIRHDLSGDHTLNTTAVVHEAYLKLAHQDPSRWENRAHFLHVAAIAMRQILINYAQRQNAQKRPPRRGQRPLDAARFLPDGAIELSVENAEFLLSLDRALERLAFEDACASQVVECRYFAGLTIQDTAEALMVSPDTVKRKWNFARAWLYRALRDTGGPEDRFYVA